jgi:hypothetical protein
MKFSLGGNLDVAPITINDCEVLDCAINSFSLHAIVAEAEDGMNGRKKVLIFVMIGDYHAVASFPIDLLVVNQGLTDSLHLRPPRPVSEDLDDTHEQSRCSRLHFNRPVHRKHRRPEVIVDHRGKLEQY